MSSAKSSASRSRYMSTRLPVSMNWSVQRPNVGIGTAMLWVIQRWSIQVISSVEPFDIAMVAGLSPSTCASRPAIVPLSLG
jgi:hypothetical protein